MAAVRRERKALMKKKVMKGKRKISVVLSGFFLTVLALLFCSPVMLLLSGSVTGPYELRQMLRPVLEDERYTAAEVRERDTILWEPVPRYPTGEHYQKLLFFTPQFFTVFWNSVKLTGLIIGGQMLIAVPAAWALAVCRFRLRKILFTLYVILMLMPFQITMLSQYLVLNGLSLMNTHWAVVFPAVFSTFPVFLIYRGFASLPEELLEAARVDGAGELGVFWHIGLPLGMPGILSAVVLGFLESWNLIEQPLAFLENRQLWPLSLYLPEIGPDQAGAAFAASVITLIPSSLVFWLGQDYLEQGIISSAIKG